MIRSGVLIVGNFLSARTGTRSVCEELAERVRSATGWTVVTTSRYPGRVARIADMLRTTWCRRHEYDVAQVDVYSGPAFVWAEAVCAVLRWIHKPYVLTLHGGNLPDFSRRWPRRVRRLLAGARAVTTPSRYLQEKMRPYSGDTLLLPNAIDLAAYPHRVRNPPQAKLVWLRAFHDTYNPSLAAKVAALLRADFPGLSVTMLGPDRRDGSLEQFEATVRQLSLTECVRTVGAIPKTDVASWLNQSDIFLNTTNVDNTPVSVLEAMACGLCIVSTNVGGIPYVLDDEKWALLVPPCDAEAMAAAVRRLLTQPLLAERLSRRGRREAEATDWSLVLPRWLELLRGSADLQRSSAVGLSSEHQMSN